MPLNEIVTAMLEANKPGMQIFMDVLTGENREVSLNQIREKYLDGMKQLPIPAGVQFRSVNMGGVPGTLATPDEGVGDRVMLYIHGGAYIIGAPACYHGLAAAFALGLNARVLMPDYRLAPEYPFPTPVEDVLASYRWLLDNGHDPRSIVFAGDSAGGAMTVAVMVMARDAGLPLPAAGAALSPWANLEHTGQSMTSRDGVDPTTTKAALDAMARTFLAGAPPTSPTASPVFADVRGLPPILIQIGGTELMLSDAIRLAAHLGENGVRVTLEVWPEMFHVWHQYQAMLPEAVQAIANVTDFLQQTLSLQSTIPSTTAQ